MRDIPSLEELQALAARLAPRGPVASRLEVGPVALERIKAAAPPRKPQPWDHLSGLSRLSGLPIVVSHALEPDGWRLVDSDGQEMTAGRITG